MTVADDRPVDKGGEIRVIPLRHYGRWLSVAVVLVLLASLVKSLITNPRYHWGIVWDFFTHKSILEGLARTLTLTVIAMTIAIFLGTILAVMRSSQNRFLSICAQGYIWFFRGTPLLVQLIFWFNLSALYPDLSFGIPFGPEFFTFNANRVITVYVAALLGLGLCESAYMCEIVRGGLNAVDPGQTQAAQALGMRKGLIFRRIVFPQAMRVIIPPTGNEVIGMLKTTALVSVIALPDLLYSAQLIYSQNFRTIPLLLVACIWYLIVTTILTIIQHFVERRFGRGTEIMSRKELRRKDSQAGNGPKAALLRGADDVGR